MNVTPPFSVTHASTGSIFMNACPQPAGRPVTMMTGRPASPSRSSASYVEASMRSPVVIVPSTSENSARTGPRNSDRGRVIRRARCTTRWQLRDHAQSHITARRLLRTRLAYRALTQAGQPVLEVIAVEANVPTELEHG